ncbi:p21-C-terminal region-binding protein-domain-containing protein [Paraphysoderma sedebokerense]|nr:p21-C-terminal region-binding protein-domain-containing protein [Paraphysoderma sedebokerense]
MATERKVSAIQLNETVSKRKHNASESDSEQDGTLSEEEIVDVDFDFFDPAEIDYHGIKRLLTELFAGDAASFDLVDLTEMIISQSDIGSTVKVDGKDSDPYAFMTVINMDMKMDKTVIKQLKNYILEKSKSSDEAHKLLKDLLKSESKKVGLIFNERLINMPWQISSPLYKMLQDELNDAAKNGQTYDFDYFILLSKTYKVIETAAERSNGKKKEKKKQKTSPQMLTYVNLEDEYIENLAEVSFDFKPKQLEGQSDVKLTFFDSGISPARRCFLIHRSKLPELVKLLDKLVEESGAKR